MGVAVAIMVSSLLHNAALSGGGGMSGMGQISVLRRFCLETMVAWEHMGTPRPCRCRNAVTVHGPKSHGDESVRRNDVAGGTTWQEERRVRRNDTFGAVV